MDSKTLQPSEIDLICKPSTLEFISNVVDFYGPYLAEVFERESVDEITDRFYALKLFMEQMGSRNELRKKIALIKNRGVSSSAVIELLEF